MTVGGAMSGYCAIGRIELATSPAITMMIAMTPASTGRSMRNFENMSACRCRSCGRTRFRWRLRDDRDTRLQLHEIVDDHSVADVHSAVDDPVCTDPGADLHRSLGRLAACIDDPHEAAEVSLQHGGLRH